MQGKTVIVTGAGAGVGLEAAHVLALQGASLVLIELDRLRGETAVARIEEIGPKPRLLLADLSLQSDIRKVADEILATTLRIDVLINNAGAWFNERKLTPDGLERTFALNHIGYFLLTHLLLDRLKATAPARIVSTSSDGHAKAELDFDDLQTEKNYSGYLAYCRSKLANVLFTRSLASRLKGAGVTANCFHPGYILSPFHDNVAETSSSQEREEQHARMRKLGFVSPSEGPQVASYLASSSDVEGVTGKYFENCKITKPSRAAQDDVSAERLWNESLRLCGLI